MKKVLLITAIVFTIFSTKGQVISGDVGLVANATPQFGFSPVLNAQYHLKNKDYVGLGVLYDWVRSRETYIVRYGTDWNQRWYFNSGIGFVNDWSVTIPGGYNRTFRTYVIGVDYIFKKIREDNPSNFYAGFDFTDEKLYLKAGIKFGHEKRKK